MESVNGKELFDRYESSIKEAVAVVSTGTCKRIDVADGVKVYACKNIIRIDLKHE